LESIGEGSLIHWGLIQCQYVSAHSWRFDFGVFSYLSLWFCLRFFDQILRRNLTVKEINLSILWLKWCNRIWRLWSSWGRIPVEMEFLFGAIWL